MNILLIGFKFLEGTISKHYNYFYINGCNVFFLPFDLYLEKKIMNQDFFSRYLLNHNIDTVLWYNYKYINKYLILIINNKIIDINENENFNNELKNLFIQNTFDNDIEYVNYILNNIPINTKYTYKKKLSIVMTYYNRPNVLERTLKSFEDTKYDKNLIEVICYDDCSKKKPLIVDVTKYNFTIKLIYGSLEKNEKIINPSYSFNNAFKYISGDYIIIQNAECFHIGDIISYSINNISENNLISFPCWSTSNDNMSDKLFNCKENSIKIKNIIDNEWKQLDHPKEFKGWYNERIIRPECLHFCNAFHINVLNRVGIFDIRYDQNMGYDDINFANRFLYNHNLDIIIPEHNYNLLAVHQFHGKYEHFSPDKNLIALQIHQLIEGDFKSKLKLDSCIKIINFRYSEIDNIDCFANNITKKFSYYTINIIIDKETSNEDVNILEKLISFSNVRIINNILFENHIKLINTPYISVLMVNDEKYIIDNSLKIFQKMFKKYNFELIILDITKDNLLKSQIKKYDFPYKIINLDIKPNNIFKTGITNSKGEIIIIHNPINYINTNFFENILKEDTNNSYIIYNNSDISIDNNVYKNHDSILVSKKNIFKLFELNKYTFNPIETFHLIKNYLNLNILYKNNKYLIKKSNLKDVCFTKELINSSFDYSYLIKNNKLWNCPIEKVAFTFWHGNEFTYLHFLSIETFAVYNPDFKIIIYTINEAKNHKWITGELSKKIECKSWFNKINNLSSIYKNIEIKELNNSEIEYSKYPNNIISDLVRWSKLHEHGGVWFDTDILFRKPIHYLFNDILKNCDINKLEFVISNYKNKHDINGYTDWWGCGLLMGKKGNSILKKLVDKMEDAYNSKDYNSVGPNLAKKNFNDASYFLKNFDNVGIINDELLYPFDWNNVDKYFNDNIINSNVIGLHWYNGSNIAREYLSNLSKKIDNDKCFISKNSNTICNEIKDFFQIRLNNNFYNICCVIDSYEWAHHINAKSIKKVLEKINHNVYIYTTEELRNSILNYNLDIDTINLFVLLNSYDEEILFKNKPTLVSLLPKNKTVHRISDYSSWINHPDENILKNGEKMMFNTISNSSITLISCKKINKILESVNQNKNLILELPYLCNLDLFTNSVYSEDIYKKNKLVIGWIGNASPECHGWLKGLESIKKVCNNLKDKVELVYHNKFEKNNISHKDTPNFYKNIDIYVCFSSYEGSPNTIFEASACGRAWVSTDVGNIPEMLEHNPECGIMIEKNETILEETIINLYNNREKIVNMGKNARIVIEKYFNYNFIVKNTFEKIFSIVV